MKYFLIILFLIPAITNGQLIADTVYAIQNNGDTVKVVTYRNFATTSALPTNGNGASLTGLSKSQISLSNVDNTSDANKPVSTATQTALNLKANLASPTFTGTVSGVTATMVGLGNVTNESKATMFTSPTFTGSAVLGTPASGNFGSGTFTWPTFNQNTTGSAATLTTPRTIQGVSFNGSANINIISGTGFVKSSGTTLSYDNSTYQPLATNLTAIGALANGSGFLKNNGSGVFTYDNPAGSGTVTDLSIVSANGVSGSVATSTSTPAITLSLGAITPTTVNGVTITDLLPKTTTSGVAASPTASGTVTVTHNLGRTPNTIRIKSISSFTSNAAATPVPFSEGTWNSTGNRCLYMVINGTTTQVSQTSTVFSIIMVTSAGNQITGVIQNVTSTQFDIVFSETGTHTAGNYIWEAQ